MNYYDNGEPITKERMQDEPWYYGGYQDLLEMVVRTDGLLTVEGLMARFNAEDVPNKNYTQEQLLR